MAKAEAISSTTLFILLAIALLYMRSKNQAPPA